MSNDNNPNPLQDIIVQYKALQELAERAHLQMAKKRKQAFKELELKLDNAGLPSPTIIENVHGYRVRYEPGHLKIAKADAPHREIPFDKLPNNINPEEIYSALVSFFTLKLSKLKIEISNVEQIDDDT